MPAIYQGEARTAVTWLPQPWWNSCAHTWNWQRTPVWLGGPPLVTWRGPDRAPLL